MCPLLKLKKIKISNYLQYRGALKNRLTIINLYYHAIKKEKSRETQRERESTVFACALIRSCKRVREYLSVCRVLPVLEIEVPSKIANDYKPLLQRD